MFDLAADIVRLICDFCDRISSTMSTMELIMRGMDQDIQCDDFEWDYSTQVLLISHLDLA